MKKLKGIGLLELMLALAIISVLLVAATRYFASTDSSRKVNDAASMLQAAINASEDVRTSDNNYSAIESIETLRLRGLVPDSWTVSSTLNPWGGGINVVGKKHADYVTLILSNIPQVDCQALIDIMIKKRVRNGNCTGETDIKSYAGDYSS